MSPCCLEFLHRSVPVVLVVLAVLATGCEKKPTAPGQGPSEVRLGYFANLTHAQAVLGVSSGDFARAVAPAKLSTKIFNAGPSLIEALFAGEIDLGYIGPGPAISGFTKSNGRGLRIIAGVSANGVLIVARKDAGIHSLEDLKGKRIATPQLANTQDISARHYLLSVLKQANTSTIVPVANAEQAGMMARKQIDAAWAPEPWGSRLIVEADATLIAEEKDLWPNKELTLAVIIVRPEFLRAHADAVEKFLRVHCAWTERLRREPQVQVGALGDALFALTGKRLPPGVLDKAIGYVKFTDDPLPDTLETMARWSHELGFVKERPVLDGMVDLTMLNRLQGESK